MHNAPVELREKLAVPEAEWPRAIEELCSYPHVEEAAILSTCNRMEIYVVAASFHRGGPGGGCGGCGRRGGSHRVGAWAGRWGGRAGSAQACRAICWAWSGRRQQMQAGKVRAGSSAAGGSGSADKCAAVAARAQVAGGSACLERNAAAPRSLFLPTGPRSRIRNHRPLGSGS